MKKEKLDLQSITPNIVIFSHSGQTIHVKQYLDVKDREIILNAYSNYVNSEILEKDLVSDADNVLAEKAGIMFGVIDVATNIDIDKINENIDIIVSSGLWNEIKLRIENFSEVEKDILDLQNRMRERKSLVPAIVEFLDFLQNSFSDDQIKNMLSELITGKEELSKVYPQIKEPEKKTRKPRTKKE